MMGKAWEWEWDGNGMETLSHGQPWARAKIALSLGDLPIIEHLDVLKHWTLYTSISQVMHNRYTRAP